MMAMERSRCQPPGYVLVITNHAGDARIIRESLLVMGPEPLPVEWVSTLSEGLDRLKRLRIEAIILNLSLPDSHGIETFDKVAISARGVPILVLSDSSEEEVAKEAVRRGAQDYLPQDRLDAYSLPHALQTVMALEIAAKMPAGDRERAEATLDSIGDAILSTDNQGKITYLNAVAERMMGWTLGEARGRRLSEVFQSSTGKLASPPLTRWSSPLSKTRCWVSRQTVCSSGATDLNWPLRIPPRLFAIMTAVLWEPYLSFGTWVGRMPWLIECFTWRCTTRLPNCLTAFC